MIVGASLLWIVMEVMACEIYLEREADDRTAAEIDAEIREIIEDAYEKSKDILEAHLPQLHLIAKYLIQNEKIDGDDFKKLMDGEITEADFEAVNAAEVAKKAKKDQDIGQILDVTVDDKPEQSDNKSSEE